MCLHIHDVKLALAHCHIVAWWQLSKQIFVTFCDLCQAKIRRQKHSLPPRLRLSSHNTRWRIVSNDWLCVCADYQQSDLHRSLTHCQFYSTQGTRVTFPYCFNRLLLIGPWHVLLMESQSRLFPVLYYLKWALVAGPDCVITCISCQITRWR